MDQDYILCECNIDRLTAFVESLEPEYEIKIAQDPNICLTMIKARDSVENQPFYLGEALTSSCEVVIQNTTGYGLVLEDQPKRAYCIAVIDVLTKLKDHNWPKIEAFLHQEWKAIQLSEKIEQQKIMQSTVDFKLMEES